MTSGLDQSPTMRLETSGTNINTSLYHQVYNMNAMASRFTKTLETPDHLQKSTDDNEPPRAS